ncbi:acyl carrier protein phosphodiesterase [soil metagenome]
MNYLAHAHLSFGQPDILVGNMISDFVKGKKQYDYSLRVQKGIRLHRAIDIFTDEHSITKEMKQVFRPVYGLYAGAFTDIVYDYFLANDTREFDSEVTLEKFSVQTYAMLESRLEPTPVIFQQMFPYMKIHNWLYNYRLATGIQKSFAGMTRRAKFIIESETAFKIFEENLPEFKNYYNEFFPLLKNHAAYTLQQLLNTD